MRLSAFSLPAFCTNRLRPLRERGWTAISAADYSAAWARWGGSVATHPDVVSRLSALAEIPVDYFGWFAGDELQAAIPTWGRHRLADGVGRHRCCAHGTPHGSHRHS